MYAPYVDEKTELKRQKERERSARRRQQKKEEAKEETTRKLPFTSAKQQTLKFGNLFQTRIANNNVQIPHAPSPH